MNRLLSISWGISFWGVLLFIYSCNKKTHHSTLELPPTQLTIKEAKEYFEERYPIADKKGNILGKHPKWEKAQIKDLVNGSQGVVVPLYKPNYYIKVTDNKMVKFGFLNYLMMYRDSSKKVVMEWVELKPSEKWLMAKTSRKYDGNILVRNWDGKLKKIYTYEDGIISKKNYLRASKITIPQNRVSEDDQLCFYTITMTITTKENRCGCLNHTYAQIDICDCAVKPSPGATYTVDVNIDIECELPPDDPEDPWSGGTPGGGGGGGGGSSNGGNYTLHCNADPDYQVPATPPPPGEEYAIPCSELDIPIEDLPPNYGIDIPTPAENLVNFYNSDSDPLLHLSAAEMQYLFNNPEISEQLQSYLMSESPDVKVFGKWAIGYLVSHPSMSFEVFKNQFLTSGEGVEEVFDESFWDNPANSFPPLNLPSWANFEAAFPKRTDPLYNTSGNLYTSIGGDVLAKVGSGNGVNTCAARVSKALNYSGVTIPHIPNKTFQGSDGKYYFIGAANLNRWMRKTFGCANPNISIGEYLNGNSNHYNALQSGINGSNLPSLLNGIQGIFSMVSSDYNWATGHADLMNATATCDGGCHFDGPIKYVDVWRLQ